MFKVWGNEFCQAICDCMKDLVDRMRAMRLMSEIDILNLMPNQKCDQDHHNFLQCLVPKENHELHPIFGKTYIIHDVCDANGQVNHVWSKYAEIGDSK